ncbi:MAG: hypothetical protein G3I10_11190 [Ferrovum sp.]|nr:hypothetical protein [Ferrovum sp.]
MKTHDRLIYQNRLNRSMQSQILKFPDSLELGSSILIIMVIILLMIGGAQLTFTQAEESEGVTFANLTEQIISLYQAEHGRWPPRGYDINALISRGNNEIPVGYYLKSIQMDSGGAFTLVFDPGLISFSAGHQLTYRPVRISAPYQAYFVWVCGSAQGPRGSVVTGENYTDIARFELPPTCRG